jgi:hypothetical protein
MNPIIQMLMGKLQNSNPQGYQMISQMMNSGGNPETMIKQMFGNATPQQRQQVLNQAKSYGAPTDILSKLQNMK